MESVRSRQVDMISVWIQCIVRNVEYGLASLLSLQQIRYSNKLFEIHIARVEQNLPWR